jgi:Transposase DDE domain
MTDNLKRYYAIQQSLKSLQTIQPTGNFARHLGTLAMLISGIIGSRKVHLPTVAQKIPSDAKPQSIVRRMERFLANDKIDAKTYYVPYVKRLLENLKSGSLILIIDASEVGRECVMLSINVVYEKRSLPLCWLIVKGKKGHLPEETHKKLLEKTAEIIPKGRSVVFLGDGEFDGVELLHTLENLGWKYVCRTAINVCLTQEAEQFSLKGLSLKPGDRIELPDVSFTAAQYGPVLVCAIWEAKWQDPLILVSNFDFIEEVSHFYPLRFEIETFFSDQKSRGFYVGHSHISDPSHLDRLLIASCLAYLWLVGLGFWVVQTGNLPLIHRSNRCDWSLFRIGLSWIEYCLNKERPLTIHFPMPRGALKSVG